MMLQLNRKGMSPVVFLLMAFVIAGLYLIVTVFILKKPIAAAGALFSEEIRKSEAKECQRLYEQFLAQGITEPPDTDKDGFPNRCDFCYGPPPSGGVLKGDDSKDSDIDGLPDHCDNDLEGPPKRGTSLKDICECVTRKPASCLGPDKELLNPAQLAATWDRNRNRCKIT